MLWYFLHIFSLLTLQDALFSKVGIRVLTSFSAKFEISCWFVPNDVASFWAVERASAARGEGSLKLSSARADFSAFCRSYAQTQRHTDINTYAVIVCVCTYQVDFGDCRRLTSCVLAVAYCCLHSNSNSLALTARNTALRAGRLAEQEVNNCELTTSGLHAATSAEKMTEVQGGVNYCSLPIPFPTLLSMVLLSILRKGSNKMPGSG